VAETSEPSRNYTVLRRDLAPWIEILHDPPIAAYTHGFAMMEGAPQVDKEGYLNLPQGPGWGVAINKALLG
jgi:L-alanine-DL-glutamate epimerase-like enolase superfamily enzyme